MLGVMKMGLFDKVFDFNNDGKADLFEICVGLDASNELKDKKRKQEDEDSETEE